MTKQSTGPDPVELSSAEIAMYVERGKRLQSEAVRGMFTRLFSATYNTIKNAEAYLAREVSLLRSRLSLHS